MPYAAISLRVFVLALVILAQGCAGTGGERGVVAADHPLAAEAGASILRMGGNAVDAAVATSFALSVVRPESCGIGGGGFMVISLRNDPRHGNREIALDYRERAPGAVGPDYFERLPEGASQFSGHAVAVPGTVAGLLHALDRYGTLPRETVLAPAIAIAREGFALDASGRKATKKLRQTLDSGREGTQASDAMLRELYLSGERVRNPRQAEALELIAVQGAEAVYAGPIGKAIARAVQSAGGAMTMRDLSSYRLTETRPLVGSFRGHRLLTMPLPSSGGVALLEILRLLELRQDLLSAEAGHGAAYAHVLIEAFKFAFADRARYLGDPEFTPDPTRAMLDDARLRLRAATIDPERTFVAMRYQSIAPLPDDAGTSHLCVVDRWGSAVACTETINLAFGSRIGVPEYGFCLNNEMDDFLTRSGDSNAFGLSQSLANLPAPGKRPLSSMCPVIALDAQGDVRLVAGGSGGPRIITGVAQVILNVLIFGLPAQAAVDAPRLHHQWLPDAVQLELLPAGATETTPDFDAWRTHMASELARRGHTIVDLADEGVTQLIVRGRRGWSGAADPRKGGNAAAE